MNSDDMSLEKAREAIQKHISCANVEEMVCSNTECPNCEFRHTHEEFMQALEIALEVLDEKIEGAIYSVPGELEI